MVVVNLFFSILGFIAYLIFSPENFGVSVITCLITFFITVIYLKIAQRVKVYHLFHVAFYSFWITFTPLFFL